MTATYKMSKNHPLLLSRYTHLACHYSNEGRNTNVITPQDVKQKDLCNLIYYNTRKCRTLWGQA